MEMLAVLFLIWIFVTIIGHGSYLLIRTLFQAVAGQQRSPASDRSVESDISATRRMILELSERDLLTPQETEKLHDSLRLLTMPEMVQQVAEEPVAKEPVVDLVKDLNTQGSLTRSTAVNANTEVRELEEPIVAELVSEPAPAQEFEPAAPVLSKAEIIRSFLAANNIRWGELVAGLLIVVCSIGLVISLWNPITENKFVPSMIFLGANAAIYAAGFYTLSRWRLRHTSRAVLVIATLLVPLTVLAGIAAAGTGADAVRLTDPLTLLAIGLASAVYGFLVFRGGNALARRPYALPIALAVAGPVAAIPMLPAAIRNFGPDAGWLVGIGSIAVAAALSLTVRMRSSSAQMLGATGGRARLLVTAFAAFAMSVTVGYAAFALREFGQSAMMTLAFATTPAIVALAAAGRSLATGARRDSQAMSGSILCAVSLGLACVVLPPASVSESWVWSWGLLLAISTAAATWLFREPRWLAVSTIPVGIAATLTSTAWMGNQSWPETGFWNRMIAGEPMLAAAMVGAVVAGLHFAFRLPLPLAGLATQPSPGPESPTSPRRRGGDATPQHWLGLSAIFWLFVSLSIAFVLTSAPISHLGIAPWWSVTAVLGAGMLVSAALANKHRALAVGTIITTIFASASVFRPLGTEAWFEFAPANVWMYTSLAIATGLLAISETFNWFRQKDEDRRPSMILWNQGAHVVAVLAASIACATATSDWSTSAIVLAGVSGLLFWCASLSRSSIPWISGQVSLVAVAIVIGYGRYNESLFGTTAWQTGVAPFGWAILGSTVVAALLVMRQLADAFAIGEDARLHHWRADYSEIEQSPIGWVSLVAAASVAVGAAWSFAALLSSGLNGELGNAGVVFNNHWLLPNIAFVSLAAIVSWLRFQESETLDASQQNFTGSIAVITGLSIVAWLANHVAITFSVDPQVRIIAATSLASLGYLAVGRIGDSDRFAWLGQLKTVAPGLAWLSILLSSTVLLSSGWLEPVFEGRLADRFTTLAVAAWWAIGSAVMFVRGNRKLDTLNTLASSVLAPTAAFMIVPVFNQSNPVVWAQVAAITSAVWCLAAHWLMNREQSEAAWPAIILSRGFLMLTGVGSAVVTTMHLAFDVSQLAQFSSIAGACVSAIAVIYWCAIGLDTRWDSDEHSARLPWNQGVAIAAGQLGWLASQVGWVSGIEVVETIAAIWLITSIVALVRIGRDRYTAIHIAVHIAGVSGLLLIVDSIAGTTSLVTPWLALIGVAVSGCMIALADWADVDHPRTIFERVVSRGLGWLVIGSGGYLLAARVGMPGAQEVVWTAIVAWTGVWVVLWRMLAFGSTERDRAVRFRSLPDVEFAVLIGFAAFAEVVFATVGGSDLYSPTLSDPLWIARVVTFSMVGVSAIYRADRTIVSSASMATLLSVVSLISVRLAIDFDATTGQRFATALLSAGFAVAFHAHWIAPIATGLSKLTGASANRIGSGMAHSTWQSALVIAGLTGLAAVTMIIDQVSPVEINLTIIAIAMAAWAIAVVADTTDRGSLRHVAVAVALSAIGLWASVNPIETSHPILITMMRWLVASVFAIPMALFVFPKMIGTQLADKWRDALKRGAMIAGVTAGVSLAGILVQEVLVRSADGIDGISSPMVIGVAVTLSILSGLAGLIAILSGPTSSWRERLDLTDGQRVGLIYAAQGIGAITWLHLFLCKTEWAFVGLRGYWPYIVMAIAFVSVGATEWARRRGDRLLSRTLQNTAMYLPLIPVIGFWFGVSSGEFEWLFNRGKVRYDVLLTIGAAYYIAVSAMWKETIPRIAAIVLGNAAWWVVLTQQGGWSFLAHPQAWLIPPAVCVLVAVHLYRGRLEPNVASAIRYSATLAIYISSTADMLLQNIGNNIWGPIILILLALAGMAVGVVLRVRPFLYLGAMFVFIGVTSMVYHAQQAIGEVWPWWVFGISTGICLLGGLMALEKNKPKLRKYANELSTWQG